MDPYIFSKEDLDQLSNPEIFKKRLNLLGNMLFNEDDNDEVAKKFFETCPVISLSSSHTDPDEFKNIHFYRVRLRKTLGENESLYMDSTFSYPPSSAVKYPGRANIKGRSVFYCSDAHLSAILECDPAIDDVGYLSMWKPKTTSSLNFAQFILPNISEYNNFRSIAEQIYDHYCNHYRNAPAGPQMIELWNFIATKFISEKYPYSITAFIADFCLYGEYRKDFIIYPGNKSENHYNNFAFHPNAVNDHLQLARILKFKVLELAPSIIKIGYMRVGTRHRSSIIWEDATDDLIKDFQFDLQFNHVMHKVANQ